MKKYVALVALTVLFVTSGFAAGNPDLVQEIEQKVFVDLSDVELDGSQPDYVMVNFRIVNDEIKILEISGTNRELKERIVKELCEIHIDSAYEEQKTYVYRFTFEKV